MGGCMGWWVGVGVDGWLYGLVGDWMGGCRGG